MASTSRKPATKPNLTVVPASGPDLAQLETVLTDFAAQQGPMLSRSSLARQQMEAEVQALEGELAGIDAREALVQRAYEAAMVAFEADKSDVRRAIGLRTGGLTQDALSNAG